MTLRACAGEACQDGKPKFDPKVHKQTSTSIPCYDPGSMVYLGTVPADSADQACAPTCLPSSCTILQTQCSITPFDHCEPVYALHRCGARLRRPVKRPRWGAHHQHAWARPPVLLPSVHSHARRALSSRLLQVWKQSSFQQRRLLLKTLLKYIIQNQDTICRCGAHAWSS